MTKHDKLRYPECSQCIEWYRQMKTELNIFLDNCPQDYMDSRGCPVARYAGALVFAHKNAIRWRPTYHDIGTGI
jgi:hypothetical protein